ncbi:MAG: hypothetical protein RL616_1435, partial [Verrucomicrobiota bacterium]
MSTASPTYFESAEATDVGRKRKNNEDACLRLPQNGVYCVADGMGGQAGGDLASQAIVAGLQEIFKKNSPTDDDSLAQRLTLFRTGVNQASQWIKKFSDEKAIGQMGSTVVGLMVDPKNPRCAASLHAGDSRLYRFRAGELRQITADHSAVAMLAAKLGRSPESLPAKFQNDLLRAVGLTESVELDKNSLEVASGDLFLLCSDGLTKMLKDEEIKQRLLTGLETPLAALAQQLIDAANEAGGRDNVTVMLVKAGELPPAPANWSSETDDDEDAMTALAPTVVFADEETFAPAQPDAADIHGETPQTENPAAIKFFPPDKSPAASPPPVR